MKTLLACAVMLCIAATLRADTLDGDLNARPDGSLTLATPPLNGRHIRQDLVVLRFESQRVEAEARRMVGHVVQVSGQSAGPGEFKVRAIHAHR